MFSWLSNGKTNADNTEDETDTKQSIDSTDNNCNANDLKEPMMTDADGDEVKSAPMTDDDENTIIPTPQNYPLHAAVLTKDAAALTQHIANLPSFDPLLPDKTRPINQRDHHGYTALHLCVYLSWHEGIDILLRNGASTTIRSRSGWTAMQESISTSQREILKKFYLRNMEQVREGLALRAPIIRNKLREKDDFYVEIDWKFSSWIPFVSRFCPSDTFKIWKRGTDFRLDMSLVDFESFSWKRGHVSLMFIMNPDTDKAEFYMLNHVEKTKQVTSKQKEMAESKNEREIDDNIEHLLQSDLMSPQVLTSKIEIEKAKSFFGYDKTVDINGVKCVPYELKNLIVLANKKDSHVPAEVKQQRAITKQLFKSKVEASKKGQQVDMEEIGDLEQMTKSMWQCAECTHLNQNEYVFCEQCTAEKPEAAAAAAGGDSEDVQQLDDTHESENVNSNETVSRSASISSILGKAKRYEYAPWQAPAIDMNEYFDVDAWQQRKMDRISHKVSRKKMKATDEVMLEKKETFKFNKSPSQISTKSFKLNLAMAESFGVSIEEILAILEAAAPQSKLAAKLKEFLEIKMPRGFPIQLELPLFHILKATVTFQNYEHINPSKDVFEIPENYLLVEKEKCNDNSPL